MFMMMMMMIVTMMKNNTMHIKPTKKLKINVKQAQIHR